LLAELLAANDQHGAVHPHLAERRHGGGVERLGEIEALHLGREVGAEIDEIELHILDGSLSRCNAHDAIPRVRFGPSNVTASPRGGKSGSAEPIAYQRHEIAVVSAVRTGGRGTSRRCWSRSAAAWLRPLARRLARRLVRSLGQPLAPAAAARSPAR